MRIKSWSTFKGIVDSKGLDIQYIELEGRYEVVAVDGAFILELSIPKNKSADQTDFEVNYIPKANKKISQLGQSTGRLEVISYEPETGSSTSIPSHDWTDPTTWYQKSVPVVGEVPTLDTGSVYDLASVNVIDVTHGKITGEWQMAPYAFTLTDNGVEKVEGTDYTVDYAAGKVTVNFTPTALVANYFKATTSHFEMAPDMGNLMRIRHAEIQFTEDVQMSPIWFEVWAGFGTVLVEKNLFKGFKDIINIARGGTGKITNLAGMGGDLNVFPFNYDRVIDLKSSLGMSLILRLDDDAAPMIGEWGTITFYTATEAE